MIIFIHGFNSCGNSNKAQYLCQHFPEKQVLTPTLASEPAQAIEQLTGLIDQADCRPGLIGSSLGGFYATYLAARHRLPAVLINPLVEQHVLRHEIGPQQNYYTEERYNWTAEYCDQLDAMAVAPDTLAIKPLLLLDQGDELLDSTLAARHFEGQADIHLFPGGSHRFEHMDDSLPLMRDYLPANSDGT